jgi:hypothetical protein
VVRGQVLITITSVYFTSSQYKDFVYNPILRSCCFTLYSRLSTQDCFKAFADHSRYVAIKDDRERKGKEMSKPCTMQTPKNNYSKTQRPPNEPTACNVLSRFHLFYSHFLYLILRTTGFWPRQSLKSRLKRHLWQWRDSLGIRFPSRYVLACHCWLVRQAGQDKMLRRDSSSRTTRRSGSELGRQ